MAGQLLLIEDDKAQRLAWKKIFEQVGQFNVCTATDGFEGLKGLEDNLNVIILDMSMPKLNGVEFLNKFYQTKKYKKFHHIPIVALTVWSDLEDVRRACDKFKNVLLIDKEEDGKKVVGKVINFVNDRAKKNATQED